VVNDIPSLIGIWARRAPSRVAVIDDVGSSTYGELWLAAERCAEAFRRSGIAAGDRIALAMEPSAPHLALALGTMLAGAISVPLNTRLTRSELEAYLEPLEPATIVVDQGWDGVPGDAGAAMFELSHVWRHADLEVRSGMAGVRTNRPRPVAQRGAFVFPTGGTTGTSKGALWSHRAAVRYVQQVAFAQRRRAQDRELCYSPFYHIGLLVGPIATLATGGAVRVMRSFDPERAVAELDHGITRLFGPPTMYSRLRAVPAFDTAPRHLIRGLMTGGASVTVSQLTVLAREFPRAEVTTAFASTETGAVTDLDHRDVTEQPRVGVGRALAGVDITVLGSDGRALAPGTSGELVIRTPWQADGYWGRPAETAETWTVAGIRGGDIGEVDDTGWLTIRGRAKEMIKSGGENVFPAEVERIVMEHPGVEFAVAYGVADELWGERVEVAVVGTEPSLTSDALRSFCRAELAGYKMPKSFRFVDVMPMTAANKPDRRALVRAAGGIASSTP
jgi:fatty-acyl-CoA synthase